MPRLSAARATLRRSAGSWLGAASLLSTSPASAQLPSIPPGFEAISGQFFFATNNSAETLSCRLKWSDREWSAFQAVPPGAELVDRPLPAEKVYVFCEAPVRRMVYELVPGVRYSFLGEPSREILLREIQP